VRLTVVLASLVIAALSLGGCASGTATSGTQAYASANAKNKNKNKQAAVRDPWTMQTPFGVFYSQVPRQRVAYNTGHGRGTIGVDTPNRYLYYVLGDNEAIRYSIAVGQEGYG